MTHRISRTEKKKNGAFNSKSHAHYAVQQAKKIGALWFDLANAGQCSVEKWPGYKERKTSSVCPTCLSIFILKSVGQFPLFFQL